MYVPSNFRGTTAECGYGFVKGFARVFKRCGHV